MNWLDLLAVQETLKSLLEHHSSKASILQRSAFFIVQLSHAYMWTLEKGTDEPICRVGIETQTQEMDMRTWLEGGEGGQTGRLGLK